MSLVEITVYAAAGIGTSLLLFLLIGVTLDEKRRLRSIIGAWGEKLFKRTA